MDPYRDDLDDLRRKLMWDMAIASPHAQAKIVHTETRSVKEVMDELRERSPWEAMMLGEFIVQEDDGA